MSTPNNQKKGFNRPKSAEPGSPLLRRALSPDRLHPRSAENKTSISPLANTVVKVNPRVTIAQTSSTEATDEVGDATKESNESKSDKKVVGEQKVAPDYSKLTHGISINIGNVGMSNSCGSTQLPRIAEEKDSPTGTKSDDYSARVSEISENRARDFTANTQQVFEPVKIKDLQRRGSKGETSTDKESTPSPKKINEKSEVSSTNLDKHTASSSSSSGKPNTFEASISNKSFAESSPEGKKILKRYKFDGLSFGSSSHEKTRQESVESKKNK